MTPTRLGRKQPYKHAPKSTVLGRAAGETVGDLSRGSDPTLRETVGSLPRGQRRPSRVRGVARCRPTKRVRIVCDPCATFVICRNRIATRFVLYACFIGDSVDYVLNQLLATTLVKDRDFVAWRQDHPMSRPPDLEASLPTRIRRAGRRAPQRIVTRHRVGAYRDVLSAHREGRRRHAGMHEYPFPRITRCSRRSTQSVPGLREIHVRVQCVVVFVVVLRGQRRDVPAHNLYRQRARRAAS
jgi:hypothetical protein